MHRNRRDAHEAAHALEMLRSARKAQRWDLVQRYSARLLGEFESLLTEDQWRSATRLVTAMHLRAARDQHGMEVGLEMARDDLLRRGAAAKFIEAAQSLDLLLDGMSAGLVQVASWLRSNDIARPDLALTLLDQALRGDPRNAAALTSRAAAFLDVGNLTDAEADLATAYMIDPFSVFVDNVALRMNRLRGLGKSSDEFCPAGTRRGHRQLGYAVCARLLAESQFDECFSIATALDRERSTIRTRYFVRMSQRRESA